jgi:hypothetical protein
MLLLPCERVEAVGIQDVVAFRALVLVPRPKNTEVKNSLSEQARLQKRS